ncbi:MAG: hypothetical protein ABIV50_06860 [Opitutus sp.]
MKSSYRVVGATLYTHPLRTRMPFRYGIATMTELPHAFVEVLVSGPRGEARGLSADHLPPKWFTKDPTTPLDQEIATMREVIVHAASLVSGQAFQSVFGLWRELWKAQAQWARAKGYPALLAQFGTSLIERAVIDAFCRLEGVTFIEALDANRLGINFSDLDPSLPADWRRLLPATALTEVVARHTVGLADIVFERDLTTTETPDDGLPRTLETAVRTYGLREFKIKFGSQWETEAARLQDIFVCLEANAASDWRFSLDGNESFADANAFRATWERLSTQPWLQKNLPRLLFIEQPVSRTVALSSSADWRSWPSAPAITIDESDGDLGDVPRSLELGYAGSTHKNCKGIFKGILNRCRLIHLAQTSGRRMMMSGEDLSNIGPVALTQDLLLQAVLGNRSVERNGHHYFRGLSMWPESVQSEMLKHHPDLYDDRLGFPSLAIAEGRLRLDSVLRAPFGYAADIDPRTFCENSEAVR